MTAANAIISMWRRRELGNAQWSAERRLVAAVSKQFIDLARTRHWGTHFALALSLHADGDHRAALGQYRAAEATIRGDPQIDAGADPWSRHLAELAACVEAAEAHQPPPSA